jgi:hypothetical protein
MKLESALKPPAELGSGRFFRTAYFPTLAALLFLLVLTWAGAPGQRIHFGDAWRTMTGLGVGEVLLVALGATLLAMLVQPLQLGVVRLLEGGPPEWLGATFLRSRHLRVSGEDGWADVQERVDEAAKTLADKQKSVDGAADSFADKEVQSLGARATWLRSRYPGSPELIRPTALGNALAAAESTAGAAYGLDAVVVWPRLYPLLAEPLRVVVDDLRDGLDAAARLAATGLLTAVLTVALLLPHSGAWTLLALVPLGVAVLAYRGAVEAAVAYGRALHVAFDLHRFDLLKALRLPPPKNTDAEQALNRQLSDFFRQGVPVTSVYADPSTSDKK